tara:strand:+ start:549 stop:770 length:222 start_codon:yes stop_codon:yes gene_type:complete
MREKGRRLLLLRRRWRRAAVVTAPRDERTSEGIFGERRFDILCYLYFFIHRKPDAAAYRGLRRFLARVENVHH